MPSHSKARRIIRKWVDQAVKDRKPIYLCEGSVFMYPSGNLERANMEIGYPVIWLHRMLPSGRVIDEFLCSCKGFWFSDEDDCRHVRDLRQQIADGKAVG